MAATVASAFRSKTCSTAVSVGAPSGALVEERAPVPDDVGAGRVAFDLLEHEPGVVWIGALYNGESMDIITG